MNDSDLESHLITLFESLQDARDEIAGDDDDTELAEIARDVASDLEDITDVQSFDDAALLTSNCGLVIRTASGATFQITIVQTKVGC